MNEHWTKLFLTSVIGTAIFAGTMTALAEDKTVGPALEDTQQQIYLDQMAKYPVLSKQFSKEIENNAHPRPTPSEGENLFLWQLEDYKTLNTSFADTFAKNVESHPAPATPEEVYLWQLEDYKKLDKTFYKEHRTEF